MTLSLSLTLCISPCQVVLAFASAGLVTSRPCSLLAQVVLACLHVCLLVRVCTSLSLGVCIFSLSLTLSLTLHSRPNG